jgi:hypothetical protein
MKEWMPENPYPGGYDKQDTVRSAFEEGRDQGFEDGCQQAARKIVEWLDKLNTLKHKSLKGTADEFKHCGLGIPIDTWQQLRKEVGL